MSEAAQADLFPDSILGSTPLEDGPGDGSPQALSGGSDAAQGAPAPSWREHVPSDLASHPALQNITDMSGLVKGYVESQDALEKRVQVPTDQSSPDDWNAFYKSIGRPDTPEGYAEALKDEGFQWAEGSEVLQKAVHDAGLTAKQVSMLSKTINEMGAAQQADAEKTQDNVIQSLRGEWGKNFDQRLGLAREAVKQFGTEGINEMLSRTGAGNDPAFIKMMSQVGQTLADQGMIDGQSFGVMSREDAAKEAERITALPAYSDPSDPDHNRVVEEATRLFNIAYASDPIQQ